MLGEPGHVIGESEQEVQVELGCTVGQPLKKLTSMHSLPQCMANTRGNLAERINVFVNGRNVLTIDNFQTVLKENDRVLLFTPMAGG